MRSKAFFILILAILMVMLPACNLPRAQKETPDPNAFLTVAAETVQAQLTLNALLTPQANQPTQTAQPDQATPTPPAGQPPALPTLTNTPPATNSPTPICNMAQFIKDVTIPDGSVMTPGQTFNKKWRLKNIGVCPWNGFSLVFDSGESMNGPASKPIPTVNPGEEVDLDVDLTAPNSPGSYRGYWRIATNASVLVPIANGYQGKSFYVDIKVQAPTATNTAVPTATNTTVASVTVTLSHIPGESGQVRSDGTVLNPVNVGDTESNAVAQGFVSFDMTSIPAGATITSVIVDFGGGYDTLGNPWALGDGCVCAYVQNYGALEAGDFFSGAPSGAVIRWCSASELASAFDDNDMKAVVQAAVGSSRLQLRLQFKSPATNNNGAADMIGFGTMKLIVTYQ